MRSSPQDEQAHERATYEDEKVFPDYCFESVHSYQGYTTKEKPMKKILWLLLLWPLAACGQVAPTSWQVSLTWTSPTPAGAWLGCVVGQPSCAYILSRATVAAGTTSCP